MKYQATDSVMTAVNKDLLSGRFDLYDSMAYFVIDGVLRDKFHVGYFIFSVLALESHSNLRASIAYREASFGLRGMDLQRIVPKDIEVVISNDGIEHRVFLFYLFP